jgi:Flp pilus assembly protein TadD
MAKNENTNTDIEQFLRQAEAKIERKDYQGAVKFYNRILEINPNDTWTYWERALAKKSNNDFQGALRDLNAAIEIDPSNSFAYIQRGLIREKNGDKKGAESDFEKAKHIREENPPEKQISNRQKKEQALKISKEKDGRSALDYVSPEGD